MKIALTCSVEENSKKYFIMSRYPEYITKGAEMLGLDVIPSLIPPTNNMKIIKAYAEEYDGFLFTGGNDVHPKFYGEEKLSVCGEVDLIRDDYELALLHEIQKLDKPVFGICRGIQVMNVSLGGSLWQDIHSQVLDGRDHTYKLEDGSPRHIITASGWIKNLLNGENQTEAVVNSYHHQAVKTAGEGFKIAAVSSDGIVEAAESEKLSYFKAVQWHPEMMQDELSMKLICDFLSFVAKTVKE